jgi:putative membrane protein insertion efficiency factor
MTAPELLNLVRLVSRLPQSSALALIAGYRYTLAALVGLECRHLPTCSAYAEEAIRQFGLWAGGWMTAARLGRCHPLGTSGLDFVPAALPEGSHWYLPWRYGRWRGTNPGAAVLASETTEPRAGTRNHDSEVGIPRDL